MEHELAFYLGHHANECVAPSARFCSARGVQPPTPSPLPRAVSCRPRPSHARTRRPADERQQHRTRLEALGAARPRVGGSSRRRAIAIASHLAVVVRWIATEPPSITDRPNHTKTENDRSAMHLTGRRSEPPQRPQNQISTVSADGAGTACHSTAARRTPSATGRCVGSLSHQTERP